MDERTDPVAEADQAAKQAKLDAQVEASFYNELTHQDVPPDQASWITRDYIDWFLNEEAE